MGLVRHKGRGIKSVDTFREAGGNFIDTANIYTNGTSESFLGEFMQGLPGRGIRDAHVRHLALANEVIQSSHELF
jgi:aryl-alcohol dehydrogenase-like predicted oxidoreductase